MSASYYFWKWADNDLPGRPGDVHAALLRGELHPALQPFDARPLLEELGAAAGEQPADHGEHQRLAQMNAGQIQLHPEVQRLVDENDLLREELTGLLAEAEQLVQLVKPNLLAMYQTRIGAWELRLLRAQWETARARREIELIQASLNRGLKPDLREIEGLLDLEFLSWQERVREAAERIHAAEQRLKQLLHQFERRGQEHRATAAQDQLATHHRQKMRLAAARQTQR